MKNYCDLLVTQRPKMAPRRATVFTFLREELRLRNLLSYLVVFIVCFVTAKFGQYLFYDQNTSPALIWPPFGIALAAILIGGNRMWLPIALAELLAASSAGVAPLPVILAATLGPTLQPLFGTWVMNKFGFDRTLGRARDAFILIAVAFIATMIAPSFSTLAQIGTHALNASFVITWVRSWAAGILSILILTPLITAWLPSRPFLLKKREVVEVTIAVLALVVLVILLSWTTIEEVFGISSIYLLLGVLIWISLRMEPRILTVAMFLLTVLGMGGSFYLHSTTAPLNDTLFGQELFIEFLAVIFLVFSGLVEERRRGRLALEQSVVQLERALERIEKEDVAKNEFIATLAHELRNPLAPVVSALDLLTLQHPSEEAQQTIAIAQRELGVMRRLLDDILDVARIAQTRFRLQKETVDVRPLLERCVESTKNFLRNRKHTLTVTLPDSPVILEVDPVRFQQVIVNLLNNAGKYTESGGRIELSCEKAGSYTKIQVKDNGIGIPPGSLNEIFEPFRQIRPTPQIGTGLGIGLWLTKRLVEMQGGTIEVQSEGLERGSCFIIYLPLQKTLTSEVVGKQNVSSFVIPPFKILIADDNEAAAQAMQKLLKLKGHDPHVAYDGVSAIAKVAELSPEVVLLDIGLPDMNGYDVAQTLRKMRTKATLIALTGYGQEEDKVRAKEAGFDHHLTKPVGIADIERVLAEIQA